MDLKHIDNVTERVSLCNLHANYVDKEADCELAQLLGHYSSLLLSTVCYWDGYKGTTLLRGEPPRHRNNCTFLNVMFHMRPSSPWRHVVLRLRLEYWPRHDHDLPPLTIQNITYSSWLLYQIIKCWSILVRHWMVRTENCWGTNLRAAVQTKQWPTWKLNSVQVKDLKLCREVLYQR